MSRYRRLRQAQIASQGSETYLVRPVGSYIASMSASSPSDRRLVGCRLAAFAAGGHSSVRIHCLFGCGRQRDIARVTRTPSHDHRRLCQPAPRDVRRCLRRHLHRDGCCLASGRDLSHGHGRFSVWTGDRCRRGQIGATVGATLIFLIARTALGEPLLRLAGPRARQLAKGFRDDAFNYLLFLRLVPVFPFFLVNLVPAFAGVHLRPFVAATAIGVIPAVIVFSLAGMGLDSVIAAQKDSIISA